MSQMNDFLCKLKEKGIKHIITRTIPSRANRCLIKVIYLLGYGFYKHKALQDVIIIESHNDFDSNGGAFYDYLIANGYNKKYKIVWFLRNKCPKNLPENVEGYRYNRPSIKRVYYHCVAKYIVCGHYIIPSIREGQKSYYTTHGCGGLKNAKGKINIPENINYILLQSETYAPIQADQYSLPYPSERLVYLGYPSHDVMYNSDGEEILKITRKKFDKIIIWMPTFRKGVDRNDSTKEQPLGIPLLTSLSQYLDLNNYLSENNSLLIIKLHPMQDLSNLKIEAKSNIVVLTGDEVKRKNIDIYKLLPCTDGMISDYSGAAYEYLQLDKPMAYVLDDMDEYKLGFVVKDIDTLLAGQKIFTFDDLIKFIRNIVQRNDAYIEKRHQIRDYIYKYHDGNSCKRIAEFMGLKREKD